MQRASTVDCSSHKVCHLYSCPSQFPSYPAFSCLSLSLLHDFHFPPPLPPSPSASSEQGQDTGRARSVSSGPRRPRNAKASTLNSPGPHLWGSRTFGSSVCSWLWAFGNLLQFHALVCACACSASTCLRKPTPSLGLARPCLALPVLLHPAASTPAASLLFLGLLRTACDSPGLFRESLLPAPGPRVHWNHHLEPAVVPLAPTPFCHHCHTLSYTPHRRAHSSTACPSLSLFPQFQRTVNTNFPSFRCIGHSFFPSRLCIITPRLLLRLFLLAASPLPNALTCCTDAAAAPNLDSLSLTYSSLQASQTHHLCRCHL